MAESNVLEMNGECALDTCPPACKLLGSDLSGDNENVKADSTLSNGILNNCSTKNGLLKVTDVDSKSNSTSNSDDGAEGKSSELSSHRSSSTSDSGISGSDADHTPSKCDDEASLSNAIQDECVLTDNTNTNSASGKQDEENGIEYVVYESEAQMPNIMSLITKDLSEPYSIYTYRYFIHNWPKLCFLVSVHFYLLLAQI